MLQLTARLMLCFKWVRATPAGAATLESTGLDTEGKVSQGTEEETTGGRRKPRKKWYNLGTGSFRKGSLVISGRHGRDVRLRENSAEMVGTEIRGNH